MAGAVGIDGDMAQAARGVCVFGEVAAAVVAAQQATTFERVNRVGLLRIHGDFLHAGAEQNAAVGTGPIDAAIFAAQDAVRAGRREDALGLQGGSRQRGQPGFRQQRFGVELISLLGGPQLVRRGVAREKHDGCAVGGAAREYIEAFVAEPDHPAVEFMAPDLVGQAVAGEKDDGGAVARIAAGYVEAFAVWIDDWP